MTRHQVLGMAEHDGDLIIAGARKAQLVGYGVPEAVQAETVAAPARRWVRSLVAASGSIPA